VRVLFGGEFSHSIDPKGRITIPAKFRTLLGNECYIARGFEGCLTIYSPKGWEQETGALFEGKTKDMEARLLKRAIFSSMSFVEFDKQGRVLLTPELRKIGSLEKDVMVIGVGDHVELWNKEMWDSSEYLSDEKLSALADKVFGKINN
jgi:MraZ protein